MIPTRGASTSISSNAASTSGIVSGGVGSGSSVAVSVARLLVGLRDFHGARFSQSAARPCVPTARAAMSVRICMPSNSIMPAAS